MTTGLRQPKGWKEMSKEIANMLSEATGMIQRITDENESGYSDFSSQDIARDQMVEDIDWVLSYTKKLEAQVKSLEERVKLADSLIDVSWKLFLDGMKFDHEGNPDPPLQGDGADYFELFSEYENKYRMPELEEENATSEATDPRTKSTEFSDYSGSTGGLDIQ